MGGGGKGKNCVCMDCFLIRSASIRDEESILMCVFALFSFFFLFTFFDLFLLKEKFLVAADTFLRRAIVYIF